MRYITTIEVAIIAPKRRYIGRILVLHARLVGAVAATLVPRVAGLPVALTPALIAY